MKKAFIYKIICANALILLLGMSAFASDRAERKSEFAFGSADVEEIHIENKYGNIEFNTWDKDSISFKVSIEVDSKSKELSNEILDRVIIEIKQQNNRIYAHTRIQDKKGKPVINFVKDLDVLKKTQVKIRYLIHAPNTLDLDIENKFGNVSIDDWVGEISTSVNHGNLIMFNLSGNLDAHVKYGKLNAATIQDAKLTLRSCDLRIDKASTLIVKSSGSEIDINSLNAYRMESTRDDIEIEEVETFTGSGIFTGVTIENLLQNMDVAMRLSDLDIRGIDHQFEKIHIEERATNVFLKVSGTSFTLDAEMEGGSFNVPYSTDNIKTVVNDEKKNARTIHATYGTGAQNLISISGTKGSVRFID